jgi:CYTH domain-containing protein
MIELERTFLAKQLPTDLKTSKSKEILDIYIPKTLGDHAPIRIRKNGDNYEITKKSRVDEGDHTKLLEQTITLTRAEFMALEKEIPGRRVHKTRYYYPVNGRIAEFDIFMDALTGLVLIDFEFNAKEEMDAFKPPFFCLAEVGHEDFVRGGVLCGKRYADLEVELAKHAYQKLILK